MSTPHFLILLIVGCLLLACGCVIFLALCDLGARFQEWRDHSPVRRRPRRPFCVPCAEPRLFTGDRYRCPSCE